MALMLRSGPRTVELGRDKDGHREYKVVYLVESDDGSDGPYAVMNAPGLPAIGVTWNLYAGDGDPWAFCHPDMRVSIHEEKEGEKPAVWRVEQKFSTKPLTRCQDETIEDPLLEPQKISGGTSRFTEEGVWDKDGDLIKNSSHEPIRGPQNEWDADRDIVRIEQNVASLGLATFSGMKNTLNDAPLWGMPARHIKLSSISWERLLYGVCNFYYKRIFEFEVRDTQANGMAGFDRRVMDEGTKVIRGQWDQDPTSLCYGEYVVAEDLRDGPGCGDDPTAAALADPSNFIRYKDWNGENSRVILDGAGRPALRMVRSGEGTGLEGEAGDPGWINIYKYEESNFLLLGIPVTL